MWAFKFINKETRLQVPKFKTYFIQNQELCVLWYEDENEPLEDRVPFYLRCIKYSAQLYILFIILVAFLAQSNNEYSNICQQRNVCYNYCNNGYFPSLICDFHKANYSSLLYNISYNGNIYTNFFKYPDPDYVLNNWKAPPLNLPIRNLEDRNPSDLSPQIYQADFQMIDNDKKKQMVDNYNTCASYVSGYLNFDKIGSPDGRQARLATCFGSCKDYIADDFRDIFQNDTRPNCTDVDAAKGERFLLCVDFNDDCDYTQHYEEIGDDLLQFCFLKGVYAILAANPVQFIFEFICIYLVKKKIIGDKPLENLQILCIQTFVCVLYVILAMITIKYFYETYSVGRPGLVFGTFIYVFLLDQVKSIFSLIIIYVIVVRRFMHLNENEEEYTDPEIKQIPKQEQVIPKLKLFLLKILESEIFETASLVYILLYTCFILFTLIQGDLLPTPIEDGILEGYDTYFLWVFLVEILLKTFASNLVYLQDYFNVFDASICTLSLVFNMVGTSVKGLAVLRLIRVSVILYRTITGNKNKLRHQNKMKNPVDSVIKILEVIETIQELPQSLKKEAKWAKELIEENKLYQLNFEMTAEQKNMDVESKAWLNLTTDVANDTTKWFEVDLDDFLNEIHRENDEIDPQKADEDDEKLKQLIGIQQRVWNNANKQMDEFDNINTLWNWDIFKYYEIMGDMSLCHFEMRLFMKYGLIDKFSISEQNFKNLLQSIQNETYETTQYHSIIRIIEVTRNFHYFIKQGELMRYLSDLQLMAGLLACLLHDVAHPGMTNSFLISVKHAKAIRYNDLSVLENHHCAIAFKLLLDPRNDIFELLSEAQYWNIRQIIIKMILGTDVSKHFELISAFKGRMSTKKFPEETIEDTILILTMSLYVSDHCNPTKKDTIYFKWMALQMEEFYQQGDIEKKLGYAITPFFDRTTCNPFKYQLGYIEVIIEPLLQTWTDFLPPICKQTIITKGLDDGKKLIIQKIEETKKIGAKQIQEIQPTDESDMEK